MTPKKYFIAMLFLPLILPLSVYLIGDNLAGDNFVTSILLLSVAFGGVPYIIFMGIIIFWIRKRDVSYIRKLTYVAPLLFIPLQSLYFTVEFIVDQKTYPNIADLGGGILISSTYILALGYIYVLLVNIGYIALSKANILKPGSENNKS